MKSFLFLCCTLFTWHSFSQVVNGSFENSTIADLSSWEWTCGAQSSNNAPPGAGNWCIEVAGGNLQGCFPGYAYQKLPSVINGQAYLLTAAAKALTAPYIAIYFGKINNGLITLQDGDTTSSPNWIVLNKFSTFNLLPDDTALVVLFGGLTTGPVQGYGYFDQVNLQFVTGSQIIEEQNQYTLFPNPFSLELVLETKRHCLNATYLIFNSMGNVIQESRHLTGKRFNIKRNTLPVGVYFIRLTENGNLIASAKVMITD